MEVHLYIYSSDWSGNRLGQHPDGSTPSSDWSGNRLSQHPDGSTPIYIQF